MRNVLTLLAVLGILLLPGAPAAADWDPGDGHKMHYPQLPDPNGWDVSWWTEVSDPGPPPVSDRWAVPLADDWQCSESGPVKDIHFWFSSQGDQSFQINWVAAAIYDNVAVGEIPPGGTDPVNFSQPGNRLWNGAFSPSDFTVRTYGTGQQGWFDPVAPITNPNDHDLIYQMNIDQIVDPFHQTEGEIYWLELIVEATDSVGAPVNLGWKTSGSPQFMDDAVFDWDFTAQHPNFTWNELYDPFITPPQSLDLAFVITPEPSSFVLAAMALTGLVVVAWRRRRNH